MSKVIQFPKKNIRDVNAHEEVAEALAEKGYSYTAIEKALAQMDQYLKDLDEISGPYSADIDCDLSPQQAEAVEAALQRLVDSILMKARDFTSPLAAKLCLAQATIQQCIEREQ